MGIRVFCPCGKRILAGDAMAGKQVRCPDCGDSVPVPGAGEKSSAPASSTSSARPSSPSAPKKSSPGPSLPPRVTGRKSKKKEDSSEKITAPTKKKSSSPSSPVSEGKASDPASSKPKKKKGPTEPAMPPRVAGKKKPAPRERPEDPYKEDYQRKEQKPKAANLREAWVRSFKLPFEPESRRLFLLWSLLFGALHGTIQVCVLAMFISLKWAPISTLILVPTIPIFVIFCCFLVHYSLVVLRAALQGEPCLPHPNRGDSAAFDAFLWFMGFWVSFGPLVFYAASRIWNQMPRDPVGEAALIALGIFYLPMALLSACMFDTVRGMNPLTVLTAIFRCFLPYLATCAIAGIVIALLMLFHHVMPDDIPMITELVTWFVLLYTMVVVMNLLGSLYYHQREKIGWFTERDEWNEEFLPKVPTAESSAKPR